MIDTNKVQVVILCGGEGTRVKHLTGNVPKCVYPINEKPFLVYILDYFAKFNVVHNFILCCSNKEWEILEHLTPFLDKAENRLTYADKEVILTHSDIPRGTLRGMFESVDYLTEKYALVINGDTYCEINLDSLLYCHESDTEGVITVVMAHGEHSGIWLLDARAIKGIAHVRVSGLKREVLLKMGYGLSAVSHYEGPEFVDVGTELGMKKATEILK